jgi:hypothetical protein
MKALCARSSAVIISGCTDSPGVFSATTARRLQEAYLRAFSQLASFRGEAAFGTWLGRLVLNEALGRRRRRRTGVALIETAQVIPFPHASQSIDTSKRSPRARSSVSRVPGCRLIGFFSSLRPKLGDLTRSCTSLRMWTETPAAARDGLVDPQA